MWDIEKQVVDLGTFAIPRTGDRCRKGLRAASCQLLEMLKLACFEFSLFHYIVTPKMKGAAQSLLRFYNRRSQNIFVLVKTVRTSLFNSHSTTLPATLPQQN